MNQKIEIGTKVNTGEKIYFDLVSLIKTRLLICANSGGGKSWLLRRLAELLCKIMPVVIFDWEGEFSTLREKFDFLIIGKGGDAPTDCRSAKLVMQKILEAQVSAVIDLSELELREKHIYVRLACEAAINSPKHLWRETAFIFDESHEICPEASKGSSEAKNAVLAFPTKGRKRGFLSIFATQRVHKLALDARAEMLNRMIGMTFEPDDLEVAAKLAGIHGKDEIAEFRKTMRTMSEGNFFTFGRAVSLETILVKVGDVQTSHEQIDSKRKFMPPTATGKIKKLLPQLADLPQQAAEEQQTLVGAKEQILALQRQLNEAQRAIPLPPPAQKIVEVPVLSKQDWKKIETMTPKFDGFSQRLEKILVCAGKMQADIELLAIKLDGHKKGLPQRGSDNLTRLNESGPQAVSLPVTPISKTLPLSIDPSAPSLGKCERAILSVLAQFPKGCTMNKIALLARYSISGGFRNSLSSLRKMGAITGENTGTMFATEAGLKELGQIDNLPTGKALIEYWKSHPAFSACARAIIDVLADSMRPMTMEEIAAFCNPPYEISGGFRNSLSELRTAGVIIGKNTETMQLNPEMFT